jgi:hypothetical protein
VGVNVSTGVHSLQTRSYRVRSQPEILECDQRIQPGRRQAGRNRSTVSGRSQAGMAQVKQLLACLEYFATEPEPLGIITPIDVLDCIDPNLKIFPTALSEQARQRGDLIGA